MKTVLAVTSLAEKAYVRQRLHLW